MAFAAFALQHPLRHASSLDAAWAALHRIYIGSEVNVAHVFVDLRRSGGKAPVEWRTPARPAQRLTMPTMTVADLGDFDAATYPALLDRWCLASLATWGAVPSSC
jgi:hypothetical protein